MNCLVVYVREGILFAKGLIFRKFLFVFSSDFPLFVIFPYQSMSSFLSTIFDVTSFNLYRFSQLSNLLRYLPLETLTCIIRTDLPIPAELINLVNSR